MSVFDCARLGRYFWLDEFRCRCCGSVGAGIDERLIEVLDAMREELGVPLYVSSGFRCEAHNKEIGGAPMSQHLYGRAADVFVDGGVMPYALQWLAFWKGADAVGLYEDFIHVDVRGYFARW